MTVSYMPEFLTLARKVQEARDSLTLVGRGSEFSPPDEGATWSILNLSVGYGYFSGTLLTVIGRDEEGKEVWRRMFDRPLEKAAEMFLTGQNVPGASDPWVEGVAGATPSLLLVTTVPRSPGWPSVERNHLLREPECRGCGSEHDLNVHHEIPYHVDPSRELDETNLVTVCRFCHFVICHLNDWKSWNVNARADLAKHREQVKFKPKAA